MSTERCNGCDNFIDTDYDVTGTYVDLKYICGTCRSKGKEMDEDWWENGYQGEKAPP